MVDAGNERDERHQTRTEGGRGDLRRVVRRARPVPAARAPDLVTAPFLRVRSHRRHLRLLEAPRARVGDLRKLARTALAVRWVEVDDLVDLLWRHEGSVRTAVSRLAPSFALAWLALAFARLAARARRIGRRRQMRVARVAPDDLEQRRDLLRQRRDLRFELNDPGVPRCQCALWRDDAKVRVEPFEEVERELGGLWAK